MKRLSLVAILLLVLSSFGFAGAASEEGSTTMESGAGQVTPQGKALPADAAPLEKQIHYYYTAEPQHLDAARNIYGAGVMLNHGGEPLLRRNENQELIPAAADGYIAGPNASFFDFDLRKDAVWSDGVPVTAHDWVYTFQHMANPNLANPWAWYYNDIKGFRDANQGKIPLSEIGVEAIDDYTFRIYAQGGAAPHLPALLAYQGAMPVPKHVAEQDPEHWADTVEGYVSSGPYIPTKWIHGQIIEFDINPLYTGYHKPYIQKVVMVITDGTSSLNMFLAGEIDMIHLLGAAPLKALQDNPKTADYIHLAPNFQAAYLSMDTMNPPLNNLKLRQALSHAIDRDILSNAVMNGSTVPGYSMLPPGFPGYNEDLQKVQNYDVALAKKLLIEAGYSNPSSLTLEIYANNRDPELEFVKDQWETNLGVKVNLTVLEGGSWGQRRAEHGMMIYKGPYEYDYLDPANLLTGLWRSKDENGSPRHPWRSEEYDSLVTEAGRTVDDDARIEMYQKAERILVEDVGAVFLSHQVISQVWWPYLAGIPANDEGLTVFRWLDIARYQMYIRNDVDTWRNK